LRRPPKVTPAQPKLPAKPPELPAKDPGHKPLASRPDVTPMTGQTAGMAGLGGGRAALDRTPVADARRGPRRAFAKMLTGPPGARRSAWIAAAGVTI